jgi:hypothetical protein
MCCCCLALRVAPSAAHEQQQSSACRNLPVCTLCTRGAYLWLNLRICLGCPRRFLDRLDPDSAAQSHLGLHQAWLDHPLLDSLCDHPEGVRVLLERVHMSQPPMPVWAAAAAAAAAASLSPPAAGGVAGARGVSPGKLVLAVLLKTGKCSRRHVREAGAPPVRRLARRLHDDPPPLSAGCSWLQAFHGPFCHAWLLDWGWLAAC